MNAPRINATRLNSPRSNSDEPQPPARAAFAAFAAIFAALWLAHLPWLRLPFFWDEAGYFIPAARDILLTGDPIPTTTLSNAHPPLVMFYLAAVWRLTGTAPNALNPMLTRSAMLVVAALGLTALWLIARRLTDRATAFCAVLLTALSPTVFTQSQMTQLDIAAFCLLLWTLYAHLFGYRWQAVLFAALAALAKETTVAVTLTLFGFDLLTTIVQRYRPQLASRLQLPRRTVAQAMAYLLALVPMIGWYAYHHHRTGHIFGNPDYLRYNVGATLNPLRIFLSAVMRLWHALGYMNLFVLTFSAAAVWWSARHENANAAASAEDNSPFTPAIRLLFALLILAQAAEFSVVGGALLARYMIPAIPLVVLLSVDVIRRRAPGWPLWIAGCAVAFVAALFLNPPWFISPEDNLTWTDYVRMHQQAAQLVEQRYPQSHILTAWTASDELTRPFLGYVQRPLTVISQENFSAEEVLRAAQQPESFDVVVAFSTKYQPPRSLFQRIPGYTRIQTRYFDFHQDLPPATIARLLHGRIVWQRHTPGEWIAVIEIDKIRDARLRMPVALPE
jgi:hypothetical protein